MKFNNTTAKDFELNKKEEKEGNRDLIEQEDREDESEKRDKLSNRMFPMIFTKKTLFSKFNKKEN